MRLHTDLLPGKLAIDLVGKLNELERGDKMTITPEQLKALELAHDAVRAKTEELQQWVEDATSQPVNMIEDIAFPFTALYDAIADLKKAIEGIG